MAQLTLLAADGSPTSTVPLTSEPIHVGRAVTNQVVLTGRSISGRHAAFWVQDGLPFVEDLASRNGTFRANGSRIRGIARLKSGEIVRLGSDASVRVDGPVTEEAPPVPLVCEVDGPGAFPVHGSRFVFGESVEADVLSPEEATLTLHGTGELWLGRDEGEGPLALGETFIVAGRAFVVRGSTASVTATWDATADDFDYHMTADVEGPTARLLDPRSGREHTVSAANRAIFLFVLGRRLLSDRADGEAKLTEGWLTDGEVATAIWGKAGENKNLNVLTTRVRTELKGAGFNPWFIQKRKGHVRIQLTHVRLE